MSYQRDRVKADYDIVLETYETRRKELTAMLNEVEGRIRKRESQGKWFFDRKWALALGVTVVGIWFLLYYSGGWIVEGLKEMREVLVPIVKIVLGVIGVAVGCVVFLFVYGKWRDDMHSRNSNLKK